MGRCTQKFPLAASDQEANGDPSRSLGDGSSLAGQAHSSSSHSLTRRLRWPFSSRARVGGERPY